MLKTKYFEFNRKGQLTIFLTTISYGKLLRILKICVAHARRKKIKKPVEFRFVPVLAESV